MPRVRARWCDAAVGGLALTLLLTVTTGCGDAVVARHGLGGACKIELDCVVGLICVADDPGGQCTKFCTADSECGAGNLCDAEGKCYQACSATVTCPRATVDPRYGCVGAPPRTFCDAIATGDGGAPN